MRFMGSKSSLAPLVLFPQHIDLREQPQSSQLLGMQEVGFDSQDSQIVRPQVYSPSPPSQNQQNCPSKGLSKFLLSLLLSTTLLVPLGGIPLSRMGTRGGHNCATKRGHPSEGLSGVGCPWARSKRGGHPQRMG